MIYYSKRHFRRLVPGDWALVYYRWRVVRLINLRRLEFEDDYVWYCSPTTQLFTLKSIDYCKEPVEIRLDEAPPGWCINYNNRPVYKKHDGRWYYVNRRKDIEGLPISDPGPGNAKFRVIGFEQRRAPLGIWRKDLCFDTSDGSFITTPHPSNT